MRTSRRGAKCEFLHEDGQEQKEFHEGQRLSQALTLTYCWMESFTLLAMRCCYVIQNEMTYQGGRGGSWELLSSRIHLDSGIFLDQTFRDRAKTWNPCETTTCSPGMLFPTNQWYIHKNKKKLHIVAYIPRRKLTLGNRYPATSVSSVAKWANPKGIRFANRCASMIKACV